MGCNGLHSWFDTFWRRNRQNILQIDPREAGSHSSGATNVSRLCGLPYGIATLACDVLKGTFPVWGAFWLSPDPFFISLAGLACVLGHVFSCFMGSGPLFAKTYSSVSSPASSKSRMPIGPVVTPPESKAAPSILLGRMGPR